MAKTKKSTKRRVAKRGVAAKAKSPRAKAPSKPVRGPRQSWLDPDSHKPLIDKYARSLKSFMAAMADGQIDADELAEQEQRLTALMREIEPQLDVRLHARVTELLCELTAYDLMQVLHTMQAARPQTTFRG